MDTPTKLCRVCGMFTPLESFSRNASSKDGHSAVCKACCSIANKTHYQRNKEHVKRKVREYREANPEKVKESQRNKKHKRKNEYRERSRVYRENHKERVSEYQQQYRKEHKDIQKQRGIEWRQNNLDRARENGRLQAQRRRALKLKAPGVYTAEDVRRQYKAQKGKCYWCSEEVGKTYDVDHVIPLTRGGSNGPDNIVIACVFCNRSKRDKLPHEFSDKLL